METQAQEYARELTLIMSKPGFEDFFESKMEEVQEKALMIALHLQKAATIFYFQDHSCMLMMVEGGNVVIDSALWDGQLLGLNDPQWKITNSRESDKSLH